MRVVNYQAEVGSSFPKDRRLSFFRGDRTTPRWPESLIALTRSSLTTRDSKALAPPTRFEGEEETEGREARGSEDSSVSGDSESSRPSGRRRLRRAVTLAVRPA